MTGHDITKHLIHLGLGAKAVVEPEFDGDYRWYVAYGERHAADGNEGRLVSMHTFTAPWDSWEVHPNGDEVVLCVAGQITLHQELAGGVCTATLSAGEYAINPPGVWHTADIDKMATAVFITAGEGTQIRSR